jgi:hypothetical protein
MKMAPSTTPSPKLDSADVMLRNLKIDHQQLSSLSEISSFRAAALAFASGPATLGYAGFVCYPDIHPTYPTLTFDELFRAIWAANVLIRLPRDDPRHLEVDGNEAERRFPRLFQTRFRPDRPLGEGPAIAAARKTEMAGFAEGEPLRNIGWQHAHDQQDTDYLNYWIEKAPDRVNALLTNRHFLAGLDAWTQELVTTWGIIERVFNRDDPNFVLVPELGQRLSTHLIAHLGRRVESGTLKLPVGLREEFPRMYEPYMAELYGRDPSKI